MKKSNLKTPYHSEAGIKLYKYLQSSASCGVYGLDGWERLQREIETPCPPLEWQGR